MTKIESTFKVSELKKDIMREARSIGIQEGFAAAIADKAAETMSAWLKNKPVVTRREYNHKLATILKKYHNDLAYLYENRDKII